jgi:hypothetical protein
MSYDLYIQPTESESAVPRSFLEPILVSLSGVRQAGSGEFVYGDKRQRLFVNISTGNSNEINSIGVTVPAASTALSCEPALLLSFEIAEKLNWKVFDPQSGDYLDQRTAAEVLASQKDYGNSSEEVLRRRSSGEASFWETYCHYFSCHSGWVVIPTIILAAGAAGYWVVQNAVAPRRFVWIFFATAFGIHSGRALVLMIWERIGNKKRPVSQRRKHY